jgi:uncharacterized SAM-binding protein YcdF (DUF218 family)
MSRRRRSIVAAVVVLAVAAVVVAAHVPLLRSLASWLRVEDPLQHADAIVVVAGGTPTREAMAAALYRQGWAPRVVISRPAPRAELDELIRLKVRVFDLQGESRATLERYGVPADRIVAIEEPARTTEPEMRLVRDLARERGYRALILVTSPDHTRRVKVICNREFGGTPQVMIRAAREEFPFDDWWRRRRAAERVLHEYLGLFAVSTGLSTLLR